MCEALATGISTVNTATFRHKWRHYQPGLPLAEQLILVCNIQVQTQKQTLEKYPKLVAKIHVNEL